MRTLSAVVVLSLALGAGSANAGNPPGARAPTDDAVQAKEHYKRGTKLYDLGKYDEAIKEFEAAFEIKDEPVLLYNIAQAHRLANRYPDALRFYRTYLRRSPKALNKSEVEQKIADMETLITQQNKIATAQPSDAIALGQRPPNSGASTVTNTTAPTTTTPPTTTTTTTTTLTTRTRPAREPETTPETTPEATEPEATPVAINEHAAGNTRSAEGTETPPPQTTPPPERRAPKVERSAKPGNGKLIGGIVIVVAGLGAVAGGVVMGLAASSAASQQSAGAMFDPALDLTGKQDQLVGFVLDGAGGALVIVGAVVAVLGARQNQQAAEKRESTADRRPAFTFVPSVNRGYAGAALNIRF